MIEQSSQTVAQVVREYIRDRHPGGVTLDVDEQGIRRERHWWHVPIRPSVEPTKRYEYYEALADVEGELEDREQLKVLLVPGDPMEVQPA